MVRQRRVHERPGKRKYDYEAILDYIKFVPHFDDEIRDKFKLSSRAFIYIYRNFLYQRNVNKFSYNRRKSRGLPKFKIGSITDFTIYYKTGDQVKAWNRINERFDVPQQIRWREIGQPLLGDLVITSSVSGSKKIKRGRPPIE